MAKHLLKGQEGENLAEKTLRTNGYRIIARNWRYKRMEIDIIAEDQGILVFVEVKTRNEASFGMPFESVDWKKERLLARAANVFISQIGHQGEVRFDIVSIILPQDVPSGRSLPPSIRLIKDAFWPR